MGKFRKHFSPFMLLFARKNNRTNVLPSTGNLPGNLQHLTLGIIKMLCWLYPLKIYDVLNGEKFAILPAVKTLPIQIFYHFLDSLQKTF